jgi:shikimate kinase
MSKRGTHQILLCGFMGCGKTSVGQALAFRLKWDFLDTDAMIEKRQGCPIPQIFAQQGEEQFRRMEEETARLLGKRRHTVISTGGGFLMRDQTVQALRSCADGFETVVFLDCSFETCYQRIKNSDRPLVRNNSREQLEQIFEQRQARYRQVADVVISNEQLISQTVEEILSQVAIL